MIWFFFLWGGVSKSSSWWVLLLFIRRILPWRMHSWSSQNFFLDYDLLLMLANNNHDGYYKKAAAGSYHAEHPYHLGWSKRIEIAVSQRILIATFFCIWSDGRATCISGWAFPCICTIIFRSIIKYTICFIIRTLLKFISTFIGAF
jgi:hypothetical protein